MVTNKKMSKKQFTDLIEKFNGARLPVNPLCIREEEIIRKYDEQQFWEILEISDEFEQCGTDKLQIVRGKLKKD